MQAPFRYGSIALALGLLLLAPPTRATVLAFSGELDFVDTDLGGAIYSGVPVGTLFNGTIDDGTFGGFLTDGTTRTDFGCCIAAGGLELTDNLVLDQDTIARLNSWMGPGFFAPGHQVDLVDIEGDATTAGGGRIEIGLSYVLDPAAFAGNDPGNYPFDPADVYLTLFFVLEQDALGEDLYSGIGQVQVVPLPGSVWLLLTGVLAVLRIAGAARPSPPGPQRPCQAATQ